ncbi:hypothetical protein AX16_004203 [Volvariella volvacea WC 439]|nr:hypothetical protein AX16_004203 [Volvariella volvacea WC 439]
MSPLAVLAALSSTLFRLASFVFLRVIPTSLAKPVLPSLFFSHLFFAWLSSPPAPETAAHQENDKSPGPEPEPATESKDDKAQIQAEGAPAETRPQTPQSVKRVSLLYELAALIFSLPSHLPRIRLFNFVINTVLFIAALDLVITPFVDAASDVVFTRIGAVLPDSVKVTARYPHHNLTEHVVRVLWRDPVQDDTWREGPVLNLTMANDWVGTARIDGLWPDTRYEYVLAKLDGSMLPYPLDPITFKTFPDPRLPGGNHFRFLATSCVTPNHPYNGPHYRNVIRGFDLMADYLFQEHTIDASADAQQFQNEVQATALPPAEFLLFLGDFIYADVPVYIGDNKEAYRRLYRRNYKSPSFRRIYERLPIFHAYDDHEFINNFAGAGNDSVPPFPSASNAYTLYNSEPNFDSSAAGQHYYEFQYGDTAFFVMDTRRYRSTVDTNIQSRTMLGDTQLAALHDWLSKVNETSVFKFVISSVPFTSLWSHDAIYDSWAGFPTEKQALLTAFHSVPNLFVLSGDRHEFAAIEFNTASGHNIYEFSTSPLSMFYIPFVRTLRSESEEFIEVPSPTNNFANVTDTTATNTGANRNNTVLTPLEKVMKYIPEGNSKWSTFEIDTTDPERPILKVEVVVDGEPSYHWSFVGKPSTPRTSSALGLFVQGGIYEIFNRIGLNPQKWF